MVQVFYFDGRDVVSGDMNGNGKIPLDKKTSLVQNIGNMSKQVRFVTAVLSTLGDVRVAPFSLYDITKSLREQVNAGDLTFSDKTTEDVNGVSTYRINHDEVKEIVRELIDTGIVTGLKTRDTGMYLEYSNEVAVPPVIGKTATNKSMSLLDQLTDMIGSLVTPSSRQLSNPCKPVIAVPAQPAIGTGTTVNPNDVKNQVQDYLSRRSGAVTMKEIQSRFKGVSKTCADYAKVVNDIGLVVDTSCQYPSKWTVSI